MNRKGFTLVELLAVVAIMAIILLIAIPNVMEGLNESKMNNFGNEVNTLYSTAKTQFNLEKGRGLVKYTYIDGERYAVYCQNWTDNVEECKNELSNDNSEGMSFKIVVDVDGKVNYMYINNKRFYYACYDEYECANRSMEKCSDDIGLEGFSNCIIDTSAGGEAPSIEDTRPRWEVQ